MKPFMFFCLFLMAFQYVTALSCYRCDPEYPQPLCLDPGPENLTDCSTVPPTIPNTPYDACLTLSLKVSFGQLTFNMSTLWCYYKSLCSFFEARACNDSGADIRSKGGSLDSCRLTKCCEDDKCNGAMKSDENTVSTPQDSLTATPIAGATGHNCVSFIFLINCAMISLMWWFSN